MTYFLRAYNFFMRKVYGMWCRDISVKDPARDPFREERKMSVRWPNGAIAAFNLQFDDFCSRSGVAGEYDFGGDHAGKINSLTDRLLAGHLDLKITLFAIPDADFKNWRGIYYRRQKGNFKLSENKELVHWLVARQRIEVACHGYDHLNPRTKPFLGAAEFEFLSTEDSLRRIEDALDIFRQAGINVSGFRPPAWGIGFNSGFGLLGALKKSNFSYVSLSSPLSGLNWDAKRVSNVYPTNYEGLLNIPQNVPLGLPLGKIYFLIDRIISYGGLISLMGHYNEEDHWMQDGIGEKNIEKIERVLDYLEVKYSGKIWYAQLKEVADVWKGSAGLYEKTERGYFDA
jgi:uncharacterized protein DUF2334